ncbi:MAG TPA: SDR family NAD(P)-dependent oxidoreductase [Pseudomonadales bacterium]|jgi:3-hydroxybutyrate dehydrogenase|nr:SDR family NAD(P)-dependent oxidoreductase [Pseudomonadales bacterium]
MKLSGKVAAVTGGSRSIGRAIVEAFLAEGARVAFNGRDEAKGARALAELGAGDRAMFVSGDARSSADVKALTDAAVARWGHLDVMVNNAGGITAPAPIAQLADDAWANDLQWNLSSVFFGTKHAFGHMLARGSGSVINISSVEGKTGAAGMAGYVAAKHGVHGLTKSAAAEAGRMGVTVNAICPGLIITDAVLQGGPGTAAAMGMSYEEMVEKVFKSKTLTGELNTVEQVAAVAVLLASETGRGITGSFFNVDGGQSPY